MAISFWNLSLKTQSLSCQGTSLLCCRDILPFPFLWASFCFSDLWFSFFLHILDNVKICMHQSRQNTPVLSQQHASLLLTLLMALVICHLIALMVLSPFGQSITLQHVSCSGVLDMSSHSGTLLSHVHCV